jgi:hypothetical protein
LNQWLRSMREQKTCLNYYPWHPQIKMQVLGHKNNGARQMGPTLNSRFARLSTQCIYLKICGLTIGPKRLSQKSSFGSSLSSSEWQVMLDTGLIDVMCLSHTLSSVSFRGFSVLSDSQARNRIGLALAIRDGIYVTPYLRSRNVSIVSMELRESMLRCFDSGH